MFDRGAKEIPLEQLIFSTNSARIIGWLYVNKPKKNPHFYLTLYRKIILKWIIFLDTITKAIKQRKNLSAFEFG